jgi:hypothetical protein
MNDYLAETDILNFKHPSIQKLIRERNWEKLDSIEKRKAIYSFVRDEIKFGYNRKDSIKASEVLNDGYGQCNTKGTLLMALFRAVGIPCQFHGFYIDKIMQKGAVTGIFYLIAPKKIIHSWVEIIEDGSVINLEGFILDESYMQSLITTLACGKKKFCGFGASTNDLPGSVKAWDGASDTYIQKESILEDLGVHISPDSFYSKYGTNLSGIRQVIFEKYVRHIMNKNVDNIRCARNIAGDKLVLNHR